jgi:hypothetical protein
MDVRPLLRVPPSSFKGAAHQPYESGRHSVTGLTPALPHSVAQWRGWRTRELAEQRRGVIPRRVRGTACTCMCQSIKWLGRVSRYGGGVPAGTSSEADLTRGGVQPPSEAEPHPRGDWPSSEAGLNRGGARPSSEAEPRPRGRLALGRGGVLLARCCAPRAKRSFARGCLGRLFWWAAGATKVVITLCVFWACKFVCVHVFYGRKWVSPDSLGDPYGCPRQ